MLLTRSRSTALPFDSSGSRCWPAPGSPSSIVGSGGGGSEPGARGWVAWQSTKRSPSSDCGRMMQEASSRKSWKAGSVIFRTTIALPGSACGSGSRATISSSRLISVDSMHADVGAGDADLLAGDEEAAVVEGGADQVGVAGVALGAAAEDEAARRRRGRAGLWSGSASFRSAGRNVGGVALAGEEAVGRGTGWSRRGRAGWPRPGRGPGPGSEVELVVALACRLRGEGAGQLRRS